MLKWLVLFGGALLIIVGVPRVYAQSESGSLSQVQTVEFLGGSDFDGLPDPDANLSSEISVPFDMIGLLWDSGTVDALWLQVRDLNGIWGEWIEVPVETDHGPDEGTSRPGSSPVFTGPSGGARFAVLGSPVSPEAMILDTTVVPKAGILGSLSLPAGVNSSTTYPQPPSWQGASFVKDRSLWDVNACRREGAETNFSSAKAIVIHHTAATNAYTESQVPGIIAAHCDYHVNGRGWDDLGYNFLVDRFGNVWEGRTGSKTSPVQGAHTGGFNSQTQGVAMLGNFDAVAPTTATIVGLRQILDWLTGWHSIDPTGQVVLKAGSGAANYEDGEEVVVPSIIGHRDLGSTTCPGGVFYATLATLRGEISPVSFGYQPDLLRCDGKPITIYGTPGNDLIYGSSGADVIHGLFGNDWIFGLGGDDTICGNAGDDRLIGGSGVDRLFGDAGLDSCGGEYASDCETIPNDEIFFYREDGLFRFYDISKDGSVGSPILAGTGYTKGWTSITGVDLDGDGGDEMFFYRDDGLFRFYDVRSDGSLSSPLLAGSNYTAGWDVINAIDVDGDGKDEMFFYRDDGLFRFYDVNPDGTLPAPFYSGDGYTTGWDEIVALDLDGDWQDEMFFYRKDGLFRYYDVGTDGTLPLPMLAGTGYTVGWSGISALDLDGDDQDEMFFYRDDGLFRYYHIREDGSLPLPLLAGAGYTTGWDVVASIELYPPD